MPRRLSTSSALAAVAAAALGAGAATALARGHRLQQRLVDRRREFNEILRSGGGKRCDKKYREKSKVMHASVKKSPTTCSFRPPVQGDDELPNHGVAVDGKILKNDARSRCAAAPSSRRTVRAGGGSTGYSLRIFPEEAALRAQPRARRRRLPGQGQAATRSRRSTSATGSS